MHKINVSVRHLVEFILRGGSIDSGFFLSPTRALEGTRVHQRIQRLRKNEAEDVGGIYKKEVHLSAEYEYEGICFCIEGRADGIFTLDGEVTIEEIKSTFMTLSRIEKNTDHWHWAQAKCYAYMYALFQKIDEVSCALIYGHIETNDLITFVESFSTKVLESFVLGLIEKYWDFAQLEIDRKAEVCLTGKALQFPFGSYREGQRELAVSIYAAIRNKKKLFAQAPTGIGKTMAALFPAVKALSEGMGEKIFYLTSKVVQRQLAENTLKYMVDKGLVICSITLTAKEKICIQEKRSCNPLHCNYANGHFNRVNAAILDCIRNEIIITRDIVEEYSHKHQVCPSEYALDLAIFCHVVICDYNHVYDPKAKLRRFFQDGGDFILLQDEAHNLVDRGREMFSAGVHRKEFAALRKDLGREHSLYKSLGLVTKKIRSGDFQLKELTDSLGEFSSTCELWLKENSGENSNDSLPDELEKILSVYFTTLDFLRISDLYDERYITYKDSDYIRLFCLDPSYLLGLEQKKSRACIFFSATLTPLPYFQGILGGCSDDFLLRIKSPYPRENLCLVIDSRVSTKYKHRDQSLEAIVESLYAMVTAKPGNYMAFFPSYAYLDQVYERFADKYKHIEVMQQQQKTVDEKEFLARFEPSSCLLGFVVLGGAFSEGIDLKGDRLIGAAIVGVGLPQISHERDVISEYFTANGKNGFDYAYIYPGMNKVLQAAGRVIRTETDKGVVFLIDSRYTELSYRRLFPKEWEGYIKLTNRDRPEDVLRDFWG
ncbi:MAG: DEAD/DEAH box helicase [Defluviitaleaceae bacterium]|nr:DEAD/DEAH box helicase [Defluviitaleaceae bacterium]